MKESNHGLHFSVHVEVCSFIGIEAAVKVKGYMFAAVSVFLQEKLAFKSQFLNSYWTGYRSGMISGRFICITQILQQETEQN